MPDLTDRIAALNDGEKAKLNKLLAIKHHTVVVRELTEIPGFQFLVEHPLSEQIAEAGSLTNVYCTVHEVIAEELKDVAEVGVYAFRPSTKEEGKWQWLYRGKEKPAGE